MNAGGVAIPPRTIAVTGADGVLGARVLRLLADRDVRAIDLRRGHQLLEPATYALAVAGCDAVVHAAALHPLVADPGTTAAEYRAANVAPFAVLVDRLRAQGVSRLVLVSSTSVWRDAAEQAPARFIDERTPADADLGYAASKRECEELATASGLDVVTLRLARFARRGDPEDNVRLLYRAVDPDDAAAAVVRALDHAAAGALYAISGPTPFRPEDAVGLMEDPRAVIRTRTGHDPEWVPERIASVIVAERALHELGWRPAHPSPFVLHR